MEGVKKDRTVSDRFGPSDLDLSGMTCREDKIRGRKGGAAFGIRTRGGFAYVEWSGSHVI